MKKIITVLIILLTVNAQAYNRKHISTFDVGVSAIVNDSVADATDNIFFSLDGATLNRFKKNKSLYWGYGYSGDFNIEFDYILSAYPMIKYIPSKTTDIDFFIGPGYATKSEDKLVINTGAKIHYYYKRRNNNDSLYFNIKSITTQNNGTFINIGMGIGFKF
jgi:hypothetical protein